MLTHAHNDHCGWVPALVAKQPDVPIITTAATAALLATMWFDLAKVLSRRASDLAGDESAVLAAPVYGRDEVRRALDRLVVVPYGRRHRVGDVEVELFPAGHIVGACGVVVHAGPERVVVSGDVSRSGQRSVGGIVVPDSARPRTRWKG